MTGLYECQVTHARSEPVRNVFRYGGYYWLVDLDRLPVLGWPARVLARFDPADHLDGRYPSIRSALVAWLARHGIDLGGGRVLMLTQARVAGHVFNPLTVYWCHDDADALACVVAEVHNTYGERHCYLLRTDRNGNARTSKDFYVSPFLPVAGEYRMRLPEPGPTLTLSVALHRPGARPFVATVRGTRRPATVTELTRLALRHPLAPAVGAARIRYQGIRLWAAGLARTPRGTTPDGGRR